MPIWPFIVALIALLIIAVFVRARKPTELEQLQEELGGLIKEERFVEALPTAERAVDLAYEGLEQWTKDLGSHHTNLIATGQLAGALKMLAFVHLQTGHRDEAESYFRRAVAVLEGAITQDLLIPEEERTEPPPHPSLAEALEDLAGLHLDAKRFDQAASRYRRALELVEDEYGKDYPGLVGTLTNLAVALNGLGETEQAESALLRSIELIEPIASEDEQLAFGLLAALYNLGLMYKEQGRLEESAATLQRARGIAELYLDEESPSLQGIRSTLDMLKNL